MSHPPEVSILLPTYNGHERIERAIRSVASQSHTDWELLVLDDASHETARDSLERLCPQIPATRLIRNENNLGLVRTLNRGLALARGRYIGRIDDDDEWISPDKLQKQVDFLNDRPDHLLVGTQAIYEGAKSGAYRVALDDASIRRWMLVKNQFIHSTILFRKDGYRYDETQTHVEDYALWLALLLMGRGANLPDATVRYTTSRGSISQRHKRAQALSSWRLARRYASSKGFRQVYLQLAGSLIFNGWRAIRSFM